MTIEIDTNVLTDLDISADDFVYLYLLHAKAYDVIKVISIKPNTEDLQSKGLIKLGERPEDDIVRQKFIDTIEDSFDRMWSELLSHFPLKVYTNGNVRILRAKDADARNNQKAKKAYHRVIGKNVAKHNKIVKCLKYELEFRKSNNSLGFMQMLQTWVNQATWEQYEDADVGKTEQQERRITRKL
ncbi:MAG: hypothetical protein KJO69_09235 [Gammaproteobacteria bacterium]|nr:hypothetical protein [Gammaproteobacteria bacterium]